MDDYTKVISKKFIELVKSYHNYKIIKSALSEFEFFLILELKINYETIKTKFIHKNNFLKSVNF
jgi:hypothetical protein